MSNRFNRPEMLKENRERYYERAMKYAEFKAAIAMNKAYNEALDRERDALVAQFTKKVRVRRRPPMHERFMNWVTGC